METQIAKKQMHYYRIKSNEAPDSTTRTIATDPKNPWLKNVEATMENIEINTEELLGKTPNQAKRYVNNKLKEHQIRKMYSAAEEKSKVRDYICNKTRTAMMIRPPYMDRTTARTALTYSTPEQE